MMGDIISSIFLVLGATLALTTAIGMVRFKDTLSRMHASTKPQTFGLLLMLIGAMIRLGGHVDFGMLVLAGLFALMTAPVIAHRIGRLVYQEQRARDGLLSRDEMENPAQD
ncbi:Na+/H+ antiporter subunit G [Gordonia sp. HNM0687]|uniref:Na+/H+ antiporter subunit G n=1 Tax=Gordonia mangrovi TaxID=2665643 RepID=A0A6L7GXM1_9ACTN|nr:monovalent cation/H(+) antiporter subunit G [Gordonia mangrovi]MXP23821.1 Na+/H+ antiporter subunit G [Gordonia mangrovi]UVF80724.1 monovalent cation/H(+) antiporter subunit G [Gordonia mangrovi]